MSLQSPACPLPDSRPSHVLLAHGGGGRWMHQLIEEVFVSAFRNPLLEAGHDSARLPPLNGPLAMTTDSYVVRPLFFRGGDIGSMAVYGTVNDLAMSGARPVYLTCAFIIEEGLAIDDLRRVVDSMRLAAQACGVQIVTGDTKVVEKGKGDSLFINVTGLGLVETPSLIHPSSIQPGDAILLSGDLGRHGMAIMAQREGLQFESAIDSDSAPVHEPVLEMIRAGLPIHCLRDLTRGGLSAALNEIAAAAQARIVVQESAIEVREDVHAACEILGLDPLHIANEGRFVAFVPEREKDRALAVMRRHPVSSQARCVGQVLDRSRAAVVLRSLVGADRILDMPAGEQLPRIC